MRHCLDPDVNTILAGDLNAKSTAWHSHSMNTAGRILQSHMEQNNYTVVAPDTPTHYPDIHHHRPDVLDIAIIRSDNLQFKIKNLDRLSSDHNPVLLEINGQIRRSGPPIFQKTLINWNKFQTNLHKSIANPNPLINSIDSLESAAANITEKFQEALKSNSITIPTNQHVDLPLDIRLAISKKKRLRRLW
jgi:hypothetical protein